MPEGGQRIAKEMNEVDCMAHANHCQDGELPHQKSTRKGIHCFN